MQRHCSPFGFLIALLLVGSCSVAQADSPDSLVVMSVPSARIMFEQGDTVKRVVPGELLRIPYVAALETVSAAEVGRELTQRNPDELMQRGSSQRPAVFSRLIAPLENAARLNTPDDLWSSSEKHELGQIKGSLREITRVLRNSLVQDPQRFRGLSRGGALSGVFGRSLFLAWPADTPVYLAVARNDDSRADAQQLALTLERLRGVFPAERGKVRFRLLTRLSRSEIDWYSPCPIVERDIGLTQIERISDCGLFEVRTKALGARSSRWFRGTLIQDGELLAIDTDPETYADQVLEAEGAAVPGANTELRRALRAVIVWNAVQGAARHAEWHGLCDTMHCMINRGFGERPAVESVVSERVDPALIEELAVRSRSRAGGWIEFSRGSEEQWQIRITRAAFAEFVKEPDILEIRLDELASGDASIYLKYPTRGETISCQSFRKRHKLPSCPDSIESTADGWLLRGKSVEEATLLDIAEARKLAQSGKPAREILAGSYRALDERPIIARRGPGRIRFRMRDYRAIQAQEEVQKKQEKKN